MSKLKEYTSNVVIVYSMNNHDAKNIEDYIKKSKTSI